MVFNMFPARMFPLVNSFIMSIIMVFIMTAVITAVNTGIEDGFASRWLHAIIVAWPIAFMIILTVAKRTQEFSRKLCKID